jgi:hypothetical protein
MTFTDKVRGQTHIEKYQHLANNLIPELFGELDGESDVIVGADGKGLVHNMLRAAYARDEEFRAFERNTAAMIPGHPSLTYDSVAQAKAVGAQVNALTELTASIRESDQRLDDTAVFTAMSSGNPKDKIDVIMHP